MPFSATLALLQKALPAPLGRKGRKEPSDMQQCETSPKCNRKCVWFMAASPMRVQKLGQNFPHDALLGNWPPVEKLLERFHDEFF